MATASSPKISMPHSALPALRPHPHRRRIGTSKYSCGVRSDRRLQDIGRIYLPPGKFTLTLHSLHGQLAACLRPKAVITGVRASLPATRDGAVSRNQKIVASHTEPEELSSRKEESLDATGAEKRDDPAGLRGKEPEEEKECLSPRPERRIGKKNISHVYIRALRSKKSDERARQIVQLYTNPYKPTLVIDTKYRRNSHRDYKQPSIAPVGAREEPVFGKSNSIHLPLPLFVLRHSDC